MLTAADLVCTAAYDRKKYVWKLLYIYMLGHDVEFGHKQACDLIPSPKCVHCTSAAFAVYCAVRRSTDPVRMLQVFREAGRLYGVQYTHE